MVRCCSGTPLGLTVACVALHDEPAQPAVSGEPSVGVSVVQRHITTEECIMHGIIYLVGLVVVVLAVLSLLGLA